MALQHTIGLRNGMVVEEAYIIIQHIAGTKDSITYGVYTYLNLQARIDRKEPIEIEGYSFTSDVGENADNIFKQCYRHLKTQIKYAEAEDILEEGQEP